MTDEIRGYTDLELVQMIASQKVVLEHEELHDEYRRNVKETAEQYGVETPEHYDL